MNPRPPTRTRHDSPPQTLVPYPDTARNAVPDSALFDVRLTANDTDGHSSLPDCQADSVASVCLRQPQHLAIPQEPGACFAAQAVRQGTVGGVHAVERA